MYFVFYNKKNIYLFVKYGLIMMNYKNDKQFDLEYGFYGYLSCFKNNWLGCIM